MIKFYSTLLAVGLVATSASAFEVTFGGENLPEHVNVSGANTEVTVANGHLSVFSTQGSNGKYRADIKFADSSKSVTLNPTDDKYFAIKFIGMKPSGNLKIEFTDGNGWCKEANFDSPRGSVVTSDSHYIYYYDLVTEQTGKRRLTEETAITDFNVVIADLFCPVYEVDWMKTFASIDDITAAKDWKDDGDDDCSATDYAMTLADGTGFHSFNDMWTAIKTQEGHIITMNKNYETTQRSILDANYKNYTIQGKEGSNLTIYRNNYNAGHTMFEANSGTTTFRNINLAGSVFQMSQAVISAQNGTAVFENVTLSGFNTTSANGILNIKGGGKATLSGVTMTGNTVSTHIYVWDNGTLRLNGINAIPNITLRKGCKTIEYTEPAAPQAVRALEASEVAPIELKLEDNGDKLWAVGDEVVKGTTDASKFTVAGGLYSLKPNEAGTGLVLAENTSTINQLTSADDADKVVTVYNLQGVAVRTGVAKANATTGLPAGLYIVDGKKLLVK